MHLSVGVLPRVGPTSFHRTTTATCLLTSGQNKNLTIARNRTESLDAMRRRYISSSREEQELLSARKKVRLPHEVISRISFEMLDLYENTQLKDELTYNALEKDIAVLNIYFGASNVQGNSSI